ncbi:MAG: UDP-N-acetylmuramoyl-L-alanine--D-glutamate ligase [Bacillota bacterium]
MLNLEDKKIGVVGLSKRTGVSVAKFLLKKEFEVVITDVKSKEELKEQIDELKNYNPIYELNGHGEKALECDILVVSPGVPINIDFFDKAQKRGIKIISEIELAYQFTNAKIIAITGTNGKTTTTSLLGQIMNSYYPQKVFVAGNIGTPLIEVAPGLPNSKWLVVEVSSFQLETIDEFRADISLFLNFSPDHLDRHINENAYLNAKKRIFVNQKSVDNAILNFDDQDVIKASSEFDIKKYYISSKNRVEDGAYFDDKYIYIVENNETYKLMSQKEVPLFGKHNLMNIAFAAKTASLIGVNHEIIRQTIKTFKPDRHRLEIVMKSKDGSLIIDDSKATNVDAALKAINSFEKDIILIAGGQDRNADFTKLADSIKKNVKALIILGETSEKIYNEMETRNFNNVFQVKNMKKAVEIAKNYFEKGDCLLLSPACPSWDMYQDYKERGNIFQREAKKQFKDLR